jgi:phosphatidate cytidylyltransferase
MNANILQGAWGSPIYRETALIVISFLFISGLIVFLLRKKNYYFVVSWASIRSWLILAPVLFALFGLSEPWPLIFITLFALQGAKSFFQIMGMYHRTYFVYICYLGIIGLATAIYFNRLDVYNISPMIIFGMACIVPLIRNNYVQMIQYISLSNLAFVFLGWSFMHLALLLKLDNGVYQVMYLLILTEFCDNTTLAISRYIGTKKIFDNIDHRRTIGGFTVSVISTLFVAAAMRQLLPDRAQIYWLTSGLISSFGGLFGDMVMDVIRKDAGIRTMGAFVMGRGNSLHRMDRLIFVAPIYYYVMLYLQGHFT